jgi:hypothetical protein
MGRGAIGARRCASLAGAAIWAAGLASGATQANAAPLTMTCKNDLRQYQLVFDEDRTTLVWISGDLRTNYLVEKIKKDDVDLIVWGRTRAYGNDYVAQFAPVKSVTYHYPNLSKQTDACK